MAEQNLPTNTAQSDELATAQRQIRQFRKVQDAIVQMAHVSDLKPLMETIVTLTAELVDYGRILLLITEDDDLSLKPGYYSHGSHNSEARQRMENAYVNIYNAQNDPVLSMWLADKPFLAESPGALSESRIKPFIDFIDFQRFYSLPMNSKGRLAGVLIIELPPNQAISSADQELLQMFAVNGAVLLQNTRLHTRTVAMLANSMHEMSIMQQIDRELNDTIALPTVFNMTLDWALRFTNATVASITLYDETTDTLRTMLNYGYKHSDQELQEMRSHYDNTITHRVAHSGRVEVVPDVMMDKDYAFVVEGIRSQMAVPVLREDRVIAVITLESMKLNAFTDENVDFVQKLANRAAVAIDNARLYDETVREREKLSHILGNIGDVVIVIGPDNKIVLISQSAISALRLRTDKKYDDLPFNQSVVGFNVLVESYERARQQGEEFDDEMTLPNGRTYYTKITPQFSAGWIIVMQDITPFKETDRLKSELIATVSHDLKQPLGVMRGYLDLLQMKNEFDTTSENFVNMIDRSINNMRQLIDDLLDLARIESGMELDFEPVPIFAVLTDCIDANRPGAQAKDMTLISELPGDLPTINGERSRLNQIFSNLIGNAIKYTPPGGEIRIKAELRGPVMRVAIEDNGLGISPEDLPHIFDRFYRVRRAETESIDGTGLGLAIVKSLVEAHYGKIRVESRLGEGSTFYVTLPVETV
jgi:signal transduction histidine kinase